jgi:diadenosine tetraphosphate (Ap4A) HIT family hydrolase
MPAQLHQDCSLCAVKADSILLQDSLSRVVIPTPAHLSPADGGHLLVVPKRHTSSRNEWTDGEVLSVHHHSIAAARALRDAGWADWINYQENGNWSVDSPAGPHSHLHVYGRSRSSKLHPFGEPLVLPTSSEAPIAVRPLSESERAALERSFRV